MYTVYIGERLRMSDLLIGGFEVYPIALVIRNRQGNEQIS
jgi:hypothetical protein